MAKLGSIQKALEKDTNPFLFKLEAKIQKEFVDVSVQEEIHRYQKSRHQWLQFRDKYTNIFHATTIIRRSKNKIDVLKNNRGGWVPDEDELKGIVVDFYKNLFTEDNPTLIVIPQHNKFQALSSSQASNLSKLVD